MRVKIQLLHFQACPNVDAARAAVRAALAEEKLDLAVEEIDVEDPAAPVWVRGWGSPTILVDGQDVAGQQPSASSACRLYVGGAPAIESIRARIAMARSSEPRKAPVALPMVGAVTAAIAAYPLLGRGTAIAGSEETAAKAELHLKVKGMDCRDCTSTIANRIKKVPGVVSATVDFESGDAVVRYDGREGMASAAIKAVEDAGFGGVVQP